MKNWSLSAKLYFVLAILIASNIASVSIGLTKLSKLNDSMTNINTSLYKRIQFLNRVGVAQLNLGIRIRDIILANAPDEQKKLEGTMAERKKDLETGVSDFSAIASEQGKAGIQKYQEKFSAWYTAAEEIMKLKHEQKTAEAIEISRSRLTPLRKEMDTQLQEIVALNETRMNDAATMAASDYTNSRNQILTISFLAILFSSGLAFLIIRRFGVSIRNIIHSLNENSSQVASASHQLASSSEELSQAATEQAASLEQTAASLEQISAMISKASDSATMTETSSVESQNKAEEGRKAVDSMMSQMDEISDSNQAIMTQVNYGNDQMAEIVKVIQEIGTKTKVINEIVFQTKLLSFNASVEAARAGEHGKGFAVVAEEVGNLAQMSGNAAKDISSMLEGSIAKVEQIVKDSKAKVESLVDQGKLKVEAGVTIAKECSGVLDQIVQNVSVVSGLSQEISQASKEQSQGVGEINKAMGQLDTVTQQNSAASEEAASASEQLSAQAESLKTVISDLVFAVQGGSTKNLAAVQNYAKPVHKPTATKNSNVVHLKTPAKTPLLKKSAPAAQVMALPKTETRFKAAAGDGSVPSRDNAGFKDV